MELTAIQIDDQPVAPTFFGEGRWLTDYVTPDEPDIKVLFEDITGSVRSLKDKIIACWDWVANQVRYKNFIAARITIEGKSSYQDDYWMSPSTCARVHVGNCANKAFLLTSLVRNLLSPDEVFCTIGNLYNGHPSGHAWVEATFEGKDYILESTRNDVPMVEATDVDRYEPVHYFNETVVYAIPDRTVLVPFSACYSSWLKDYLQFSYVNRGGA